LQPQELTSDLLKLWKNQRLCPHIHMPLQSGSNAVLRRMGRGYSIDEYLQAVNAFREHVSGSAVSTDILVGFPGESEPDFEECVSVSCSVGFSKVHVFPFSSRPGTRAYMMQHSVSPADLSARVHRMLAVSRTLEARFCQSMVGQVRPVLWEEQQRVGGILMWSGLTDNYVRVHTRSKACLANRIVLAELVEARAGVLWARTVSDIP
jgi:threonylcarbamoyladenosine tRNA methylthiotransferase MtaB